MLTSHGRCHYCGPQDVVTLAVQMNSLPDGAIYAGQTTLEAKAENITVVIQNSEHRPVQQ